MHLKRLFIPDISHMALKWMMNENWFMLPTGMPLPMALRPIIPMSAGAGMEIFLLLT
jgi:hypothetical protein